MLRDWRDRTRFSEVVDTFSFISLIALSLIDNFLTRLTPEQVIGLMQRDVCRHEFIASLYTILHNSSNSTISSLALTILGRLGGKTRSSLKGAIALPFITPSSGYIIVVGGQLYKLDDVLEVAVCLLDRNLIVESLDHTETKLATVLRTPVNNIQMLRGVRCTYKQIAVHLLERCVIACFHSQGFVDPALTYRLERTVLPEGVPIEWKSDSERVVCLLLLGLLLACCDSEVKNQAFQSVTHIITSLACLMMQQIQPGSSYNTLWRKAQNTTDEILSQTFSGVLPPPFPFMLNPVSSLSPTLLFKSLTALLSRGDEVCMEVAVKISSQLWTLLDESSSTLLTVLVPCWEELLHEFLHTIHTGTWRSRVGLSLFLSL